MSRVFGWVLFDLANTFFAIAMISFYFPLWLVQDLGAKELWFSLALSASTIVVSILMPFCGALSDATGQRMRFLRWTTYGCIVTTCLIALTTNLWIALSLFAVANMCYQLGVVFYDALLWHVAGEGKLGQTSALGSTFGYLGTIMGLLMLWPFVAWKGYRAAFIPSAVLFLLFALPTFWTVRDAVPAQPIAWGSVLRAAALRLAMTLRSARALGDVLWFFGASFFSLSAISTILVFMAVYTRKVAGFTDLQVIRYFSISPPIAANNLREVSASPCRAYT
jgi:UMF1 family MFS transporter